LEQLFKTGKKITAMKKNDTFETDAHSLNGHAAIDFYSKDDMNSFASKFIARYNPDRYDATVLRMFVKKGSPVFTLYAVDKMIQEQNNYPKNKLPVRKFKINISFEDFLKLIRNLDFTVTNDAYDMKDILVMNK
jgi:hypothetical protein